MAPRRPLCAQTKGLIWGISSAHPPPCLMPPLSGVAEGPLGWSLKHTLVSCGLPVLLFSLLPWPLEQCCADSGGSDRLELEFSWMCQISPSQLHQLTVLIFGGEKRESSGRVKHEIVYPLEWATHFIEKRWIFSVFCAVKLFKESRSLHFWLLVLWCCSWISAVVLWIG